MLVVSFNNHPIPIEIVFLIFQLVKQSTGEIQAIHETPSKGYKDDLTFTLTPKGTGCAVHVRARIYVFLTKII